MTCLACINGYAEIVEYLIGKGADTTIRTRVGATPLILACYCHYNPETFEFVHPLAGSPTAFRGACQSRHDMGELCGHVAIVDILLANGIDIEQPAESGNNALLHAVNECHTDIVQRLLDHGADPNCANKAGESPLSVAAKYNFQAIVRMLLDAGADVDYNYQTKRPRRE